MIPELFDLVLSFDLLCIWDQAASGVKPDSRLRCTSPETVDQSSENRPALNRYRRRGNIISADRVLIVLSLGRANCVKDDTHGM